WKTAAYQPGQLFLLRNMATPHPAAIHGFNGGLPQDGVGMPIEPGGELAQYIEVFLAVQRGNTAAFARYQRNGERITEEHRARIAARHDFRGLSVMREAFRIACAIPLMGFLKRLLYGVDRRLGHGVVVSSFICLCSVGSSGLEYSRSALFDAQRLVEPLVALGHVDGRWPPVARGGQAYGLYDKKVGGGGVELRRLVR